jgi:iron complex transport system substrate-binding protein
MSGLVFLARLFYFHGWKFTAANEAMTIELILRERRGGKAPGRKLWRAATWRGVALVAALSCAYSAGASANAAQTTTAQDARPAQREVTDEVGRKVLLPQEVKRIVSLAPNLTEIVFALGKGVRLVGDTDYCDYPPEAEQKPHVGGLVNPNLEEVAALKPDLVLASKSINRRETVDALDRLGVPVFVTDPHSVEGMIASVEHIGAAIGAEKAAAELAQDMRDRVAEVDKRVNGKKTSRVFFIVWTDPLISIGNDTFIADAVRRAGGQSIVDTKTEWPHVSLEEVVHLQPDILVFASAHGGETHREIDELRYRPGWKDLAAMQQDNFVVVSDAINRPAPRMVDVIERLARMLHPDAFSAGPPRDSHSGSTVEEVCACAR